MKNHVNVLFMYWL